MKRTLLLLGVFILLVGAFVLMRSSEPVAKKAKPFIEVDSASVKGLGIVYGQDSVYLAHRDDGWWLEYPIEYPATERTVGTAVGKLESMSIEGLITDNPESFAKYEVDTVGVRVHVLAHGKSTGFIIGKNASDFQHTYMRYIGQNDVWLVKGSYRNVFGKALKDWRNRTITDLPMESVRKVEIIYPEETISLTWQDSLWNVTAPGKNFEGETSLVERLLRLMCKINTVEFLDTLKDVSFEKPEAILRAEIDGYEPLELKLVPFDEKGEKYVLEKTGALTHFIIYKATATTLMKRAEDFRSESLAKKQEMMKDKR
ncbi:DUF4340 domain-containing protein [bacterium]|nr:DUF4340 domain-containing protein [bacterium]